MTVRGLRVALVVLLALAAAVIIGSRWETSPRPAVVAVQAFSPVAVLLLVAALVLLLVPVGGAVRRGLAVGGSLLLVAVLVASLIWVVPVIGRAEATGEPDLTVATLNLRFGQADPEAVLDLVRDEEPDLLVLAEITPEILTELTAGGLTRLLPYSVGAPLPDASGTMAFATSPLTGVRDLGTRHSSWAFGFDGLEVWAAHPAYPFDERWDDDQRLLADAADLATRPDLALGDFNATAANPVFRALLDRTGLRDAADVAGSGWQPTWPTDGSMRLPVPLAAIDHVLVGDRLVALDTRTRTVDGTDHAALVADLRLR
jgi:endonuclease/exonuclease/phosphatase (EEP) superfamily protein YafD